MTQRTLSDRTRWMVLIGLVVSGLAGATAVYFVTSANRSSDREAVLRYETQVLAPVRDLSVVAGSLADASEAFRKGSVAIATFARTLDTYERALRLDSERIDVVKVPVAFGARANMFAPAAQEYLAVISLYKNAATASDRAAALDAADAKAAHALSLYREAARALQTARLRLGLPRSVNFSDPPR